MRSLEKMLWVVVKICTERWGRYDLLLRLMRKLYGGDHRLVTFTIQPGSVSCSRGQSDRMGNMGGPPGRRCVVVVSTCTNGHSLKYVGQRKEQAFQWVHSILIAFTLQVVKPMELCSQN